MEQLFGLKQERVISEFICAKKRRRGGQLLYHGRMYVSQNYVCWHARTITGQIKDVVIHLSDMVHLFKSRHAMINPAVNVVTRKKRYLFTSFFPFTMRDHAATIIEAQWSLFNAATIIQRAARARQARMGFKKSAKKVPFKLLFKPAVDCVGGSVKGPGDELLAMIRDDSSGGPETEPSIAGTDVGDVLDFDILSDVQNSVQGMSEDSFKTHVATFQLPVSVKQAFNLLLADGSSYTQTVHLDNQGADQVVVGRWRPSTNSKEPFLKQEGPGSTGNVGGRSRTVTFVQKVDNPLSPVKSGRGTWEQRVAWLSSGALCVEWYSTMKDVPFSDAWGIRLKWVLRPSGDMGIDSPTCQVTVSLECVWFKKIMWAGKIESETVSTSTRDYAKLEQRTLEYLQGKGYSSPTAPPLVTLQPSALSKMRTGEAEIDMLRRRLAEAEAFLRAGAAVSVNGVGTSGWLAGKKTKDPSKFVIRAVEDPTTGSWSWVTDANAPGGGDADEHREAGGKAGKSTKQAGSHVVVWSTGVTNVAPAPPAA